MRFGVLPPYRAGIAADPDWMGAFAASAEELGYESLYAVEHVVVPPRYEERYPYSETGRMPLRADCPIPDPIDLLAFLAGRTSRLRLATGVLVGPHHHPLVLAKRLATVDRLSGGRLLVGLGVGWMAEELEATGVDFSTRGARLDEVMAAVRRVWEAGDEGADFHGRHFSFERVRSEPRPVRPGGVPLHVGGHSEAAARRCGRYGDGLHPLGLEGPELAQRWLLARRTAEQAGRDPDALELTVTHAIGSVGPEVVERAESLGVHRIVCSTAGAELAEVLDALADAAERVGLPAVAGQDTSRPEEP